MTSYKAEYLGYMDRQGIKYRDVDERHVRVQYSGDNLSTIAIDVIFDEDGANLVHMTTWSLGSIKEEQLNKYLVVCNEMNKKYRWTKFYIDNDMDITLELDAVVDIDTVGEECTQLVKRMVSIGDEAYLDFMRVKLGL